MTANELGEYIGKTGEWSISGVKVEVKTTDARTMFGRVDVKITPTAGSGEAWIDSQFVKNLH